MRPHVAALVLALLGSCVALSARAQAFTAEPSATSAPAKSAACASPAVHSDVEVDPTAFALKGYSLHAGVGYRRFRLDLGTFALDVPEFFHGNKGFRERYNGAGVDLHYFLFSEQKGAFVGVGVSYATRDVQLSGTSFARSVSGFSPGAELGFRFQFPFGLYLKPWVGLSYDVSARDLQLNGHVFKSSPWSPFAAVHIGYQFL